MKRILLFVLWACIASCGDDKKTETPAGSQHITIDDSAGFFPVTSYIRGQIAEIASDGISPLRTVTSGKKIDSSWIKPEQLEQSFAEFLQPVIDSAGMKKYFRETSFHDQTLNSITFTYEPYTSLPANLLLRRWDVYVTPQTGKVKKIYMEKSSADQKDVKLTWESRGSCKIVYLATGAAGKSTVEKEEIIKWNFDEE